MLKEVPYLRLLTPVAVGIAIATTLGMASKPVLAQSAPAHDIAEKFAVESTKSAKEAERRAAFEVKNKAEAEKRRAAEQRRHADEAEMLVRARSEAESRRAEMQKSRAETTGREQDEKVGAKAEVPRLDMAGKAVQADDEAMRAAAAQAKAIAEEQHRQAQERFAEERRLSAERAAAEARAAEARRIAEAKAAEDTRREEAERKQEAERKIAEAHAAETVRQAEVERLASEARQRSLVAEREAEAQRLSARLREARELREQRSASRAQSQMGQPALALGQETLGNADEHPRDPSRDAEPRDSGASRRLAGSTGGSGSGAEATRVTVLLLMEPGNRGIRRRNKTADPLLCAFDGCYVSNGPAQPATLMPRRTALGIGRTFGDRAGACRNSLGCVFRDLRLGSLPGLLQPVDMRVMVHDRREAHPIETVSDCVVANGRLDCRHAIQAASYAMWIVPEALAELAGPAALASALTRGLRNPLQAELAPNPG